MDLLKQQICNELRVALARWDTLNDMLARNEAVDQIEYVTVRQKVQRLDYQLSLILAQEKEVA